MECLQRQCEKRGAAYRRRNRNTHQGWPPKFAKVAGDLTPNSWNPRKSFELNSLLCWRPASRIKRILTKLVLLYGAQTSSSWSRTCASCRMLRVSWIASRLASIQPPASKSKSGSSSPRNSFRPKCECLGERGDLGDLGAGKCLGDLERLFFSASNSRIFSSMEVIRASQRSWRMVCSEVTASTWLSRTPWVWRPAINICIRSMSFVMEALRSSMDVSKPRRHDRWGLVTSWGFESRCWACRCGIINQGGIQACLHRRLGGCCCLKLIKALSCSIRSICCGPLPPVSSMGNPDGTSMAWEFAGISTSSSGVSSWVPKIGSPGVIKPSCKLPLLVSLFSSLAFLRSWADESRYAKWNLWDPPRFHLYGCHAPKLRYAALLAASSERVGRSEASQRPEKPERPQGQQRKKAVAIFTLVYRYIENTHILVHECIDISVF